ncbi:MAG: thioesterase family protein [Gemmatimonadota bacterium]|jgi:YbgC/YbaW family acyl-CoA thioester hydrolase|nr:thioesterase family protein [Gemmatimonadota bacterium]MDQ8166172.1 thioesterase family protein [Gemmatimonadota bacterium]MDQ8171196.1 thioesterase family protein [Gemmatimonadota bacterium]
MTAPRPFVIHERVRWADVDLVCIMRFSAFTRLVELAEQELLRAVGLPYAMLFDEPTIWMPRRRLEIDYYAPARIDDELALVTYVSRMGDTSLTLQVDVRHAERQTLVAAISMVVVCVTVEGFAKRPLPQSARTALAPFVLTVEDARAGTPDAR